MFVRKSLALLPLLVTLDASARVCPEPWRGGDGGDCIRREHVVRVQSNFTPLVKKAKVAIRSGYVAENPNVPFRGNVIYYQGLGDSMVNQMPLFSRLSDAGYRVVAFDYMGQGGSGGDMNDTRILEIPTLGNEVLALHGRDLTSETKKIVIGWSTGGLAAYVEAINHPERIDKIVMIAPGLRPKKFVGEQNPLALEFNKITMETLTSADYSAGLENPHVDPIKPTTPLVAFTGFALDLIHMSNSYADNEVSAKVKGFALFGSADKYVHSKKAIKQLRKHAPHFGAKLYEGARHEIQNETPEIQEEAIDDIVDFVVGVRKPGVK